MSPLASNHNDFTAVHYAIQLEKYNFLAYLLEGDFEGLKEITKIEKNEESLKVNNKDDSYCTD